MARDMQKSGDPSGKADGAVPGRPIKQGQGGELPGFVDGHDGEYPHQVEGHIAHSPRTHHGDM